jgi:hypothetical protein
MAKKVLLASTLCVAVLALLGSYVLFLAPGGEAAAAVGTASAPAVEPQTTTSGLGPYTIHVPWPSGWISQMYIDANVTSELGAFGINYWVLATMIDAEYFTVSTTSYKWWSYSGNWVSQAMVVGESTTCDFGDTPLSNDGPRMTEYALKNPLSFNAWGEGLASMMGMYAPVAKEVSVLKLLCGDYAYTVRVQGHFREEPATWEYVLIPKDKNQYFTIFCHSYGMCEDEVWHIQRATTFTQK